MIWQEKFINQVICSDAVKEMAEVPENSIDSCITDPPYGLEFMGKEWDSPNKLSGKSSRPMNEDIEYPGAGFKTLPNFHRVNNVRCAKCGHWKFSGTPCECLEPEFPNVALTNMNVYQSWTITWATELYRILKPGAYLLAFGGTRTEHRLACGIEDAGFIIRDRIAWMYGSGFPKNLNIGKKWDKLRGNKREEFYRDIAYPDSDCWGVPNKGGSYNQSRESQVISTDSIIKKGGEIKSSKGHSKWEGWGTALKPAFEFIVLAQKPLDKNYCHNLEKWGCGAVNIDGGRIGFREGDNTLRPLGKTAYQVADSMISSHQTKSKEARQPIGGNDDKGRWPANLILECTCDEVIPGKAGKDVKLNSEINRRSDISGKGILEGRINKTDNIASYGDTSPIHTDPNCPCRMLDEESGETGAHGGNSCGYDWTRQGINMGKKILRSQGGASRFFKYIPKADRAEKEAGLKGNIPCVKCGELNSSTHLNDKGQSVNCVRNDHPTVKPIDLFRYLQKLFTPPKGITIDPFAGSGSSCISAIREGFDYIAIDQDKGYCKIAKARIREETKQLKLFP